MGRRSTIVEDMTRPLHPAPPSAPSPGLCRLGLALVLLAHGAVNAVWITQDQTLRSFDTGPYLYAAIHLADLVQEDGLRAIFWLLRGEEGGTWTGGVFLPYVALASVFGHSVVAFRMYNLLFVALLMWATLLLGRRLHSERAGLLAAALVGLYPLVYGEARQFGADVPGVAMTTLALAALAATDRFSLRGRTVLFGLAAGVAVMVRAQAAVFLAGPAALLLAAALLRRAPLAPRRRVLLNVGLGVLVAGAVTAVWWLGRLGAVLEQLLFHARAEDIHSSMEPSAVFYLRTLPATISPFLLLALAAGVKGLLMQRWPPRPSWEWLHHPRMALVWTWLACGFLFLSATRVRQLRYLLPLVPALALITAAGLASMRHRRARQTVVAVVLAAASALWLVDSFGVHAAVRWGFEDDPASTAPRAYYLASGPPATCPLVMAASEVGDLLARRHEQGRGVFVVYKYAPRARCELCRRYFWTARPFVAAGLPGTHCSESLDHDEAATSYPELSLVDCAPPPDAGYAFLPVGRASVPYPAVPIRHVYVVKFDQPGIPVPAPPGPFVRIFSRAVADPQAAGGRTTISVWHRRVCGSPSP